MRIAIGLASFALLGWAGPARAQDTPEAGATAEPDIIVTARRVEERAQDVPIPITVLSGAAIAEAGAFNVNRLKEIAPSLQFYSSNPRNSSVNIRGLGAPFGLTNDGIEPGVGFYVDGVFNARPAVATLDFLDVERLEVLRGPQGTLYGKNTTAGAINIVTRKPSFTPEGEAEISVGDYGFLQAKGSLSGPLLGDSLGERLAGRLAFSGTRRDGFLTDVTTGDDLNDLSNLGLRAQLLFQASETLDILLATNLTRQRPEGYAQVPAGVAPTLRAANRQYAAIAADLGYAVPSFNAFDRLTDADTPHRSNQDLGGIALTIDWEVGGSAAGPGQLTSITAWRFWDWDPSNDRDFLGLPITTISANPSEQRQWTQEVRYSGALSPRLNFVIGAFGFHQTVDSSGRQEQGAAAARFLLAPSANATPALLDGYGQISDIASEHTSAALFGQLDWSPVERLRILPGLRLNWDRKSVDYDAQVYGGTATTDAQRALQRSILAPQSYTAEADDSNVSGQLTLAYAVTERINAYATYATSFKSIGLNVGGLPTDASGAPILDAATVDPEAVRHVEIGVKSQPLAGLTVNVSAYDTTIDDYQAQVVNASIGVLRGYLANAERVRVRGLEVDAAARLGRAISIQGALAYADGIYERFPDAPAPIELTGGPQVVDISGRALPGVSNWSGSLGGEARRPGQFLGAPGAYFIAGDASFRTSFSSSPTPSEYLRQDGYSLLNGRLGFRSEAGWDVFVWGRNLFDTEYFEFLSAAPGGSGLIVGYVGDPRTVGLTVRTVF